MIVAGIDIGTLTCRLLIVDISKDGSLREINSDRRMLRLGEGVDQRHILAPNAMDRVVGTLCEWQGIMISYGVEATVAVATSAVRESTNQQEFLSYVQKETGLEIEVLSGEEEARRTLVGIEYGLPMAGESFVGLDIGGGSTELFRMSQGGQPIVVSLDLGVVRLTERCFQSDSPSEYEVHVAEQIIHTDIQGVRPTFGDVSAVTLVGTAGTVTTLAAMAQELSIYEPARIHNYLLSFEKICELENDLLSRTAVERSQLQGLEPGREGVIVIGTIILRIVMEVLGFKHCLVSDYGLREGIIVDFMTKKVP